MQDGGSGNAHPSTVYHCLYAHIKPGYTRSHLAHVFNKTEHTIGNWLQAYYETGVFQRARTTRERKYTKQQRVWLFNYYQHHPLSYLDEAQDAFKRTHGTEISKISVWRIIHSFGLTWKVLERRAIHIKEQDVFRFVEELSHLDWSHHNLVFLDERKPRVSILAFIGVNGIIDYFSTEGTFDRLEFTKCCQDLMHMERGPIRQYPGPNSIWIMDGATIHRHPEIIHYLRSVGLVVIFLPAYCPFFNPIEFLFGYVKRSFQRQYSEASGRDLTPFVVQTFQRFRDFDMSKVFEHCGWKKQGYFDLVGHLSGENKAELAAS
ncbi:hypothetical protein PHYSODRAFT_498903 [Phytophthora sojae]|uniref:Tc1-like transposase DDE domain-containing protein n=1 Tax=Phytophthora sojae (strain P6497) TaxID=1094619 RepID=G4ZD79_PHYSP|nr:hypothetical protein PHYSODRAFT_498903 [Phytophthora sojae]EGZ16884.1 hypothetical protein PHYSODRAFT_498903 [Phytophthora sojae]|eukprot:XP_009525942.1 hypothetical protein PHYSODRAFT_498903 [Phytophthora sojae]